LDKLSFHLETYISVQERKTKSVFY
jgi:hypothetical protein